MNITSIASSLVQNATSTCYGPPLHLLDSVLPMQLIYQYTDLLIDFVASTNEWNIWLQFAFITTIVTIFGALLFTIACPISYYIFFVWKKDVYHPDSGPQQFPGQLKMEIIMSYKAFPFLSILTAPFFVLELRGYSKLYWNYSAQNPFSWIELLIASIFFLVFTDTGIYWIHRFEHTFPWIYKYIHKPHHKWINPTPFAAFAFHPLDGWAQSVPYHLFVFLYPMQIGVYLGLFVFVQLWTVSIHDGVDWCGEKEGSLRSHFLNGSLHHTIHHSKFVYNYGQYFTFWDRVMGSHCSWADLCAKQERLRRGSKKPEFDVQKE